MESKSSTIPIGVWAKEHDLESKLKAALEQIVVGQGWDVFEGLQSLGECEIKVVYNGSNVSLHRFERLEAQELKLEHIIPDAELGSVVGPEEAKAAESTGDVRTLETVTAEDVGSLEIVSAEPEKVDTSESDKPGRRRRRKTDSDQDAEKTQEGQPQ